MKRLLLASASAVALLTLGACSDTDDTQTQSIDQPPVEEQQMQQEDPMVAPEPETDPAAPAN